MASPVLALQGINKTYNPGKPNEVKVLVGVDLELEAGEIVGLVAPSGAGKSTLLFIAGLLEPADTGEVFINGIDAGRASDRVQTRIRRQEVGMVYQFHHLLPEFSAQENVMLPQLANGSTYAQAMVRSGELLSETGLAERKHHRPSALSGGEQQRVAVCRSLANAPGIVLADEPTGNLDAETSIEVFRLMTDRLRIESCSALIATHNSELASRMDRVISLRHGLLT